MRRYIYNYQTVVRFSQPVVRHAVLLRAMPTIGSYMEVEEEHLLISPDFHLQRGTDQLGNRIVYGCQHEAHDSLVYVSTGMVSMRDYRIPLDGMPLMVYREPTPLTFLSEDDLDMLDKELHFRKEQSRREALTDAAETALTAMDSSEVRKAALGICHFVNEVMFYVPRVTTTDTPVSEVLKTMQGVCQDYAHLMVALCRSKGMAARYVCGMMEGEGETHAWVEVCDGDAWIGFDPTHDVEIHQGYLKLAHGRDAADCPVSRGIYMGNALQSTEVHVLLKEIY